jgi:photosystem II stability/assembly factor-like uncharacterized protein
MKKKNLICLAVILSIFTALSCKKNSNNEVIPGKMMGWAVGADFNGFGVILHSSDSGKTWTRQGDSIQIPTKSLSDVCILDDKNILVTGSIQANGNYTVLKSQDGGENWHNIATGTLANVNYNGVFALSMNNIWIAGESGCIYHSTDAGESWTKLNIPSEYQSDNLLRIAALTPYNIWVVGDSDVNDQYPIMLHTMDGGESWERLNPLKDLNMTQTMTGHFLGIKLYGQAIWAIGGPGKFVVRSADNGAHWSDVTHSPATADANDIFLLNESEAYVVTDYNGIYHTKDAGNNWTEYTFVTGNWYLGIAILNTGNIWIIGSPGAGNAYSAIIYSPDGGASWQEQTPQFLKDNIRFIIN